MVFFLRECFKVKGAPATLVQPVINMVIMPPRKSFYSHN
jgi:hypothetical protein